MQSTQPTLGKGIVVLVFTYYKAATKKTKAEWQSLNDPLPTTLKISLILV